MFLPGSYNFICKFSENIPEKALPQTRTEIVAHLGRSIREMYPDFALAFPFTVNAMEVYWSNPVAGFEHRASTGNWLSVLLLEQSKLNLFFDLRSFDYPISGQDYDRDHAMLPPKWRELYRSFESFAILDKSIKPMKWWNTPFCYSGRLNIDEFRVATGAAKIQLNKFEKTIGSDRLMCWLLTEAGDALFLDEERCDHRVFHVRGGEFEQFVILENSELLLDRYLAHYVSGRSPGEFDFRI